MSIATGTDATAPSASDAPRASAAAPSVSGPRPVRAHRGTQLHTLGWQQEGALRMLQNNIDPEVAEHPDELVVYGGTGKAARDWRSFDALVRTLETLKGRAGQQNQVEVKLRALEREATAQRQLLETYLARYREATSRSDANSTPADARVISAAVPPTERQFPKILPITIVGGVAGFLLSSVTILLAELFSGRGLRPVSPGNPAPGGDFTEDDETIERRPVARPESLGHRRGDAGGEESPVAARFDDRASPASGFDEHLRTESGRAVGVDHAAVHGAARVDLQRQRGRRVRMNDPGGTGVQPRSAGRPSGERRRHRTTDELRDAELPARPYVQHPLPKLTARARAVHRLQAVLPQRPARRLPDDDPRRAAPARPGSDLYPVSVSGGQSPNRQSRLAAHEKFPRESQHFDSQGRHGVHTRDRHQ